MSIRYCPIIRRTGSVIAIDNCSARWSASVGVGRHERLQIVIAVLVSAAAGPGPVGSSGAGASALERGPALASSGNSFSRSVPSRSSIALRLVSRLSSMRSATTPISPVLAVAVEFRRDRLGRAIDNTRLAFGGSFKQGVFFELPLDVGGEIQVRELQQLDGLHQLRRHHERLALAHLQSLSQCHQMTASWSSSCLSNSNAGCIPRCGISR